MVDVPRVTDRRTSGDRSSAAARLSGRARMHAALGEPVRLAIVDELTFGDASPGELGATTGLATNLLAHHLRVLEEAGLIRRVRSEGDKRRSYVQLRWDDAAVAALVSTPTTRFAVRRVVFVCTANSARSQLAAGAWARVSAIATACAGTRPAGQVDPRAVDIGRRHGLRLTGARPRHVAATVQAGDLVVAVCDAAHEELVAAGTVDGPVAPRLTGSRGWLHWAVPDPVRAGTDEAFETAYTDLQNRIERLAAALTPPETTRRGG
jgi:ArsR family transcriptional regulator, arsenate/arsenite/antimonite-responsive transcriptional repressor / arsenate reductase (thioredoxin)